MEINSITKAGNDGWNIGLGNGNMTDNSNSSQLIQTVGKNVTIFWSDNVNLNNRENDIFEEYNPYPGLINTDPNKSGLLFNYEFMNLEGGAYTLKL